MNSAPVIPITLAVGDVSTQAEVDANATQVETANMGVANVVDQQKVLDLPLNGRQRGPRTTEWGMPWTARR